MCQKWICLIEMSGKMLGSILEMVQQAEMPSFTYDIPLSSLLSQRHASIL